MKTICNRFLLASAIFIAASAFAVLPLKPVDAGNSVTFVIKNLGLNTRGEFSGLKGSIEWNEDSPETSKFNVTVAANTINTGIDMRDEHLKKEEYFDAGKYPDIRLASNAVLKSDDGYVMNGTIIIKGITKNVSFPFTAVKKPEGYTFSGKFTINRRDFGVGGNSVTMGDNVEITLNVTAK